MLEHAHGASGPRANAMRVHFQAGRSPKRLPRTRAFGTYSSIKPILSATPPGGRNANARSRCWSSLTAPQDLGQMQCAFTFKQNEVQNGYRVLAPLEHIRASSRFSALHQQTGGTPMHVADAGARSRRLRTSGKCNARSLSSRTKSKTATAYSRLWHTFEHQADSQRYTTRRKERQCT